MSRKGVPAALLISMIQASLRTQAGEIRAPREVVGRLNRLLCETTTSDRFATLFLGLVDPQGLMLTFTNAGHDPPIVRRANGDTDFCSEGGLLLGVMEEAQYEEGRMQLAPGDRLVLYTDGVTEARNPQDEEFGLEGLLQVMREVPHEEGPEGTLQRVVSRVRSFAGEEEFADDLTLLVLRVDRNGKG